MSVAKHDPLVAASLQNLDGLSNLLRAMADSAALSEAKDEIVKGLYFLHQHYQAECEQLDQRL